MHFPNLIEFLTHWFDFNLLRNLIWHTPYLTSITILCAAEIDDEAVDLLCQSYGNTLQSLTLSDDSAGYNPLTDQSLQSIATYCTSLTELNLLNWPHITYTGLSYLANLHLLKRFTLYSFREGFITALDVGPVLYNNNNIEQLQLDRVEMNESDLLICIGNNCPLLKHLDISNALWHYITDESVRIMTLGCPLLESLQISVRYSLYDDAEEADYNPHPFLSFTNTALYTIATNCIYFKYLHIDSPDALPYNEVGLDVLIDKCIHLRAIYNHNGIEQTSYLYYTAPGYNEREVELYIPTYKGGTKYHTQKGPYKINY